MHFCGLVGLAFLTVGPAAWAGQFSVHSVGAPAGTTINDTTQAQNFLNNPTGARFNTTTLAQTLNYEIVQGYIYDDWFGGNVAFPNLPANPVTDNDPRTIDFVINATAPIQIPTAGNYTFDVNSDDGFLLTVGSHAAQGYTSTRLNFDTFLTYNFPTAGIYNISLLYFQRSHEGSLELSAASGTYTTSADQTTMANTMKNFHLVGAADGLQVAPEPSTLALAAISSLGLLIRRRRP